MTDALQDYLEFAVDAAWAAGRRTLAWFQTEVPVERKADQSPVTAADRDAERALRALIDARFPDHGIVGEELGAVREDASHRWVLDPIDGTQSFVRGVPIYGVLVALEIRAVPVVGVCHFPALGETVAAGDGLGCWWNGRRARTSSITRLDEALVAYTEGRGLRARLGEAWDRLERHTRVQRGWGDCYGHCLVATGRAEVMLDARMSPWDCAALIPVLREAGGTFTDWTGISRTDGGDAFSTNGPLFDDVLALLHDATA
jgi:histidinol-phosphatase